MKKAQENVATTTVFVPSLKATSTSQISSCSQTVCVTLPVYTATIYTLLSSLFFSLNAVLVRSIKHIHPGQLGVYRFIGMLALSLPIAVYRNDNLLGPKHSRYLLAFRSAAAVLTIIFSFLSFRHLPVGEASAIYYSCPVIVAVFARIFLKEPCSVLLSISVMMAFSGIVLICDPMNVKNTNQLHKEEVIFGRTFGIAGLLTQCAMLILTRKTNKVHFAVVSITASTLGAIACAVFTAVTGVFSYLHCGYESYTAIVIGFANFFGMSLWVKALQTEQIGALVTLKAATDIFLAMVWQVSFFGERLDVTDIGGIAFILVSILLVGLRKWSVTLPQDSKTRKYLTF